MFVFHSNHFVLSSASLGTMDRKRGRDDTHDDEEQVLPTKRSRAFRDVEPNIISFGCANEIHEKANNLAFRPSSSVSSQRQISSPSGTKYSDITPTGSDSEELPQIYRPRSFAFSRCYDAAPSLPMMQPPSWGARDAGEIGITISVSADMEDMEMTDEPPLDLGNLRVDNGPSINGRIPTPINCHFYIQKQSGDRGSHYTPINQATDRLRHDRALPSPISEGEQSPSIILNGMADMQMDMGTGDEMGDSPKRGHRRFRHSTEGSQGGGKRFAMGYRSDCEKCRQKVPGHFSHVLGQ
jgi:hypothetical protein